MGRRKEKSDEQILLAARECFVRRGPTVATSIIAKELGISQATLFNRFKTKQDLMLGALTLNTDNGLAELLNRSPDQRSIRQQLIEIGHEASKLFQNIDPNIAVLAATGMSAEEIRQCFRSGLVENSYSGLTLWIEKARQLQRIGEINAHSFASTFLGAIRSVAKAKFDGEVRQVPDPVFIENLVDLLWNGIEPADRAVSTPSVSSSSLSSMR